MSVVQKKPVIKTFTYLVMTAIALTMLIPLFWMISTSLKDPGAVYEFPPRWIPKPIIWSNYSDAWNAMPFGRFYLNSLYVPISANLTVDFGVI